MVNFMYGLIFYMLGAVIRNVYAFLSKIVASDDSSLQLDVRYGLRWL